MVTFSLPDLISRSRLDHTWKSMARWHQLTWTALYTNGEVDTFTVHDSCADGTKAPRSQSCVTHQKLWPWYLPEEGTQLRIKGPQVRPLAQLERPGCKMTAAVFLRAMAREQRCLQVATGTRGKGREEKKKQTRTCLVTPQAPAEFTGDDVMLGR